MAQTNFSGKVAVVTGAGQGIGFEMARQIARAGGAVVINDIDARLAAQAAASLTAEGLHCASFAGDIATLQMIRSMLGFCIEKFGRLDIAIANAGITLFGDFLQYSEDAFNKVMALNLAGSFFLAQQAAIQMKNQGSGGSILFTSSVTGHQAHKNLAAYGMTKAALEMLARNLVIELSEYGINVNAIAPGATLTERTVEEPDYEKVWSQITPMGRPAHAIDIANAALFLVSDQARHITGQSLVIDGGWTSISPSPYK